MTEPSSKFILSSFFFAGVCTHHHYRVWDYTTKSLIASLEGHTSNVSFAVYHPELPIIISGSEDGTIRMWHANSEYCESDQRSAVEEMGPSLTYHSL